MAVVTYCLVLLASGCSLQKPSASDISNLLTLSIENAGEIHKDQLIDIYLENKSDYCIEFPYDHELKIYEINNEDIKEINEFSEYFGEEKPIRVVAYNKGFDSLVISFYPDLSAIKIGDPTDFYVEIHGYLCTDNSFAIIKTIPFTVSP